MQKVWIAATAAAVVLGAGLAAPATATATPRVMTTPETSVSFVSQSGDYIGGGRSAGYLAPDATISVSGTSTRLTWSVRQGDDDWSVNLVPGAGDTLHPGSYAKAARWPVQTGRAPGLDFSGDGRGCNTLTGSFTVNQIAFSRSGAVIMADVSLVQHCEGQAPALRATARFNALRLSYRQQSETGDDIGGGVTRTYLNGSSTFRASVSVGSVTHEMQFGVSGLGDDWTGLVSPPRGASFVLGKTYRTTGRSPDATHAGLDVFRGRSGLRRRRRHDPDRPARGGRLHDHRPVDDVRATLHGGRTRAARHVSLLRVTPRDLAESCV